MIDINSVLFVLSVTDDFAKLHDNALLYGDAFEWSKQNLNG